jgi:hypothetical protein
MAGAANNWVPPEVVPSPAKPIPKSCNFVWQALHKIIVGDHDLEDAAFLSGHFSGLSPSSPVGPLAGIKLRFPMTRETEFSFASVCGQAGEKAIYPICCSAAKPERSKSNFMGLAVCK